jgi:AraC family transcriptional regulator of arabinose operon
MTAFRHPTPHAPAAPLACGEFRQGPSYTNWRPRGSGDWLLLFTLGGAGRIVTHGPAWSLGASGAVLYRPDAMQDYSTDPTAGRWWLCWAHFQPKPHWLPWLDWPEAGRGAGRITAGPKASEHISGALRRMLLVSRLGGTHATELAMNALEEALIWVQRDLAGDRSLAIDPRIRKAMAALAADPTQPFYLSRLAAASGLSPSRFSHLFKAQVRVTPRQFSENLRLGLAAQLLKHTGLSVGEVAFKAGFTDPLYFSRRFARAFDLTPSATRKSPVPRRRAG